MTLRLLDAAVLVRANGVVLTYNVDGELPQLGSQLFSTTFIDGSGSVIRQLGFKFVEGGLAAAFSFDHISAMQRNYPTAPTRVSNRYTIVFALDALGGATAGTWHADLDVDGQDGGRIEGTFEQTPALAE